MNQKKSNIILGSVLISIAALLKVVTFPHSINPIIAISLFSGVVVKDKRWALAMPLFAMLASDLMLEITGVAQGFYGMSQLGNYASLLLVTCLGFGMKKINWLNVVGFSLLTSLLFYVLSNTNVFLFDTMLTYTKDLNGWFNCMVAGIPFIKNSLLNDLCFNVILFGGYAFVMTKYKSLAAVRS